MSLIAECTMITQHFWMFTERSAIIRIRRKKEFQSKFFMRLKKISFFNISI